jgi:DNA-binding transcriptional regulator LsrR (DeoR family)
MSKRTRLTGLIIDQVWGLYNRGFEYKAIATKLGISQTSVLRCVTAVSTASAGKFVEYTGLLQDSHYIADYANKKFNLEPEFIEDSELDDQDLTAAITLLANNIARQTAILDGFIKKLEK